MKKNDSITIPPIADQDLEKNKKSRAKSPATMTRNRQNYLSNLEKQLDEIMTGGADSKKLEKKMNTISINNGSGTTKNL